MTQEDLNQIRAIMREEIASSNETLSLPSAQNSPLVWRDSGRSSTTI
jgi:hypothetical protein